jgi:hypothetical protein
VKLATIRTASGAAAVRFEDDGAVDLGFPGDLIAERAEPR